MIDPLEAVNHVMMIGVNCGIYWEVAKMEPVSHNPPHILLVLQHAIDSLLLCASTVVGPDPCISLLILPFLSPKAPNMDAILLTPRTMIDWVLKP